MIRRMLSIVSFLSFIIVASAYQDFYEDFIDPYNADDTFKVACGTLNDQKMRIVFRGNAHRVFSPDSPGCEAEEVEPAHFEITDAMDPTSNCETMQPDSDLEVVSLEVVVQKGYVRSHDDTTYMVTCNYELGGQGQTAFKKTGVDKVAKQGFIVQANNDTAQSTVSLSVRDVHNNDITSSKIGSYIQLVAFMDAPTFIAEAVSAMKEILKLTWLIPDSLRPILEQVLIDIQAEEAEQSFRMWNCRAFSNWTGIFAEHYILLEGCGDGKVIKRDRGFRTYEITNDEGDPVRTARSVFFRTFALLNNHKIKFECDYIVREDTSADGPSCKRAPAFDSVVRRKRSTDLEDDERQKRSIVFELDLPSTESAELEIEPEEKEEEDNVITYHLNKDDEEQVPDALDNRMHETNEITNNRVNADNTMNMGERSRVNTIKPVNIYYDSLPDMTTLLKSPLVIGLILTCVVLLLLPVVIVCYMLVTRNRERHVGMHPRRYVAPPIFIPDTPLLDNVDLKLLSR